MSSRHLIEAAMFDPDWADKIDENATVIGLVLEEKIRRTYGPRGYAITPGPTDEAPDILLNLQLDKPRMAAIPLNIVPRQRRDTSRVPVSFPISLQLLVWYDGGLIIVNHNPAPNARYDVEYGLSIDFKSVEEAITTVLKDFDDMIAAEEAYGQV